jgi:hypothetical protein
MHVLGQPVNRIPWKTEVEIKEKKRVRVTLCSAMISVFSQSCRRAGTVGFLRFRKPCAVELTACHAARDTGILQVGDRVYRVSMNTTQSFLEYESGNPITCRNRKADLDRTVTQTTLEI